MRHFTILFLLWAGCGVDERPSEPKPESNARCDKAAPFGPAIPLDELNTDAQETSARLTPDELALFFASTRPGGAGGYDLYRATRATVYEPFANTEWLATLATPGDERDPWPAWGQSFVMFERDGDLMSSSFDGTAFGSARPIEIANTPGIERSPMLTDDGLYLSSNGKIMLAPSFYGALLPPLNVDELAGEDDAIQVVVDRPAATMLLARRPAGAGATQIWSTQRNPQLATYEPPMPLITGSNPRVNLVPDWISEDGCVMYLESDEHGDFDIYAAHRSL